MEIQCQACHTRYRLDPTKLAGKQHFAARCKKCGQLIRLNGTARHDAADWKALVPENAAYGEALKNEVLANVKKLYPMPHVMWKAKTLLADPKADMTQLGQLLKTDQALAGRILKVANSAYFGLVGQVSSIQHAIVLLGGQMLSQIIGMIGHSKMLPPAFPGYATDTSKMWRHALAVAVGSDIISQKIAPEYSNEAFLAGLLHDSGKIIMDAYILERQAAFTLLRRSNGGSVATAERELLGFDHAEIGGALCAHWNLPDFVAAAVAGHHLPSASKANMLAYIIHAADIIANRIDVATFEIDPSFRKENGLGFLRMDEKELTATAHRILHTVEDLEDITY